MAQSRAEVGFWKSSGGRVKGIAEGWNVGVRERERRVKGGGGLFFFNFYLFIYLFIYF